MAGTNNKLNKKVVVGMSGGVDSSVAAYLLKQQGYEVVGLHMKSSNAETAAGDEASARAVCEKLGIKFEVANYEDQMELVKNYFLSEYKQGKTPNPCVFCNKIVKFKPFIEYADKIGADYFATGHYAKIVHDGGKHILMTAADEQKDQSYFLNQLSQSQLEKVLFPLGELKKTEVRKIAEKLGLENAEKKDSYDVCFIGSEKFKDYIAKLTDEKPGNIVDVATGKIVGKHTGLSKYTLGQRKGLGIGGGAGATLEAWFVSNKDLDTNTLFVEQGDGKSLFCSKVIVGEFNWIPTMPEENEFECLAKFRYRQAAQEVLVKKIDKNKIEINCKQKQRSVTPGQFAVLYKKTENETYCFGGGKIEQTF